MKELKNRLVYLFTGEFFAAVIFTIVYFYHFSSNHSYPLIYMLFVLNFILLQGSFYWFVHWKRLKEKRDIFPNLYKFFSGLKKINIVLLCIVPLILIVDIIILEKTSFPVFLLIIFVYCFTIIEYINYFHRQLTNYKNGKGNKSSIAKGIEKIRR